MLHKIILLVLVYFGCLSLPTANATLCSSSALNMAVSYENSYVGSMDVSLPKGKNFKGRQATFVLSNNHLMSNLPKIGKMPGQIILDIPIEINHQGTITAKSDAVVGFMKMPMGLKFKLKLDALKNAQIVGNKISFILEVHAKMMGVKIPTSISFCGEMK